jgi:hypothetical protein
MYWFVVSLIIFAVISLTLNITFLFRVVWTRQNSRARQIAQNISLSVITFLVIAVLMELFFKLIFAQSDTFGFTLAEANWHARYVQTNSLGYRDIEWTPELLAGRTKVMVLGDSFVEGAGIKNPADRFSSLLDQKLGDKYAVMNVGMGGADTKDEIKNGLKYPYQPDILILSYYVNDIALTARDMGVKRPPLVSPPPILVHNSYALDFLYWRIFRLVPQAGETYWQWLLSLYDNPDVWRVYQGELLQLYQLTREHKITLVVVVFPELLAVEQSRPITSRVVNLYREQGVPVLDVTDLVAGLNSTDLVVNSVDSHPNEFVHGLVAEKLYQLMLDNQLTPQQ